MQIAKPDRPTPTPLRWVIAIGPPVLVAVIVLALWQFEVMHRHPQHQDVFSCRCRPRSSNRRAAAAAICGWARRYTLVEAVVGLAIGACVGYATALFFVWFDVARRGLMPLAITTNAIPIVAFVPIASHWFGFDQQTRIFIVALMTFAPMVVSAYKGLTAMEATAST